MTGDATGVSEGATVKVVSGEQRSQKVSTRAARVCQIISMIGHAVGTVLMLMFCVGNHAATAALAKDPEQRCQQARYAAAAKYAQCQHATMAKLYAGNSKTFQQRLSQCRVVYVGTWAKLQGRASIIDSTCEGPRFTVGGGTVVDHLTGLQWEQKTDDGSVHDKADAYRWGISSSPEEWDTPANGPAFTTFLATLNATCFAGHCDWRLPTQMELQTILARPYPCATQPCIDESLFGPAPVGPEPARYYWSATIDAYYPLNAWAVDFGGGAVTSDSKAGWHWRVRAVRGGL